MSGGFTVPAGWTLKGTADFNNDSEIDVVVTNGTSANQVWMLHNGAVASTVSVYYFGSDWPLIGVLDLNHDGYKDLLYQKAGTSTQEVDFYNGGTTRVSAQATSGQSPDAIAPLTGVNEGSDTVISSITYILPGAVENLTLATGAGNLNATGNGLDNTITGNDGNNIITGGVGTDTFVFKPGFGNDTITDFHPGEDIVQFDHTDFADVASVMAHAADDGFGNTTITLDAGNSVVLQNVTVATLLQHQSDFHIV